MNEASDPSYLLFPTDESLLLFYFVFARITGLMVISPIFSQRTVGLSVRFYFSLFVSLILALLLHGKYEGHYPAYALDVLNHPDYGWIFFFLNFIKELAIGYLLGLCFTLVFEAAMIAGEVVDAMTGFATAKIIDPITNAPTPLTAPLFTLTAGIIILSLDLHHAFILTAAKSFSIIPLGEYHMSGSMLSHITYGTAQIFSYALKIAAVPFVILSCGTIGIGFVTRVVHEYNPLLTGLPMRILIALYTLVIGIGHVAPTIKQAFAAFENLASRLIYDLSGA